MNELTNLTILVVDDEPLIREILEFEIQSFGAKTLQAENSTTAINLIQKNKIDVVISDVTMPGGGGLELAEALFHMKCPKPLLFLCSGFGDNTAHRALELGVSEIFPKPFDREMMLSSIQKALAGRKEA